MVERIIVEPDRPHPIRRAGLVAFILGLTFYLGSGSPRGVAGPVLLSVAGIGLGLFLLDRSQSEGVTLDALGLHDRWGTIAWRDVTAIQKSHAGMKTFLTLSVPKAGYAARVHARDENHEATDTRWSVEISGGEMTPEAIEVAARDWHAKSAGTGSSLKNADTSS